MYLFNKSLPCCLFITAILSLGSCQEKDNVLPTNASTSNAHARLQPAPGPIITLAKKYTLTNDGLATLTYGPDGKLSKVEDLTGYRLTYTYSGQTITTREYHLINGAFVLYFVTTSYLNAEGHCSKTFKQTWYPGPLSVETHLFEYNGKGQLAKRYDQDWPLRRQEYAYNALNDLATITCYNTTGQVWQTITHAYASPLQNKVENNLYPLNPSYGFIDKYQPIYGNLNKHLLKRFTQVQKSFVNPQQITGSSDYYFHYTLNEDGYPTRREWRNVSDGALFTYENYTYLISKLTLNP